MRSGSERRLASGIACMAWTLLAWSSVPLFLRYFAGYLDAWTTNGWRYGVSALIWAPFLVWRAARGGLPAGLFRAAIVPATLNTLGQIPFAWAPYYIQPGLMTFMVRLQIIFIALGAYLLFPSERRLIRTKRYWFCVMVVFAGSVGTALLSPDARTGGTSFGVALAVTAGMLFGAYVLGVRYFMASYPSGLSFAVISQYTACGLVVLMLVKGERHGVAAWELDTPRFLVLLLSGLIGIGLSHATYYAAMARLSVAVASGVILLQPFITTSGSAAIFGERLTVSQWMSGATAMGAALMMLIVRQRLEARARACHYTDPTN